MDNTNKPKRAMKRKAVKEETVPVEGLGDVVSKVTQALGIKECAGCKKRKEWLNNIFTFRSAVEMTDEEFNTFGKFLEQNKRELDKDDLDYLEQLYNKSFKSKGKLCRGCPKVWVSVLNNLTKLYNGQKENQSN